MQEPFLAASARRQRFRSPAARSATTRVHVVPAADSHPGTKVKEHDTGLRLRPPSAKNACSQPTRGPVHRRLRYRALSGSEPEPRLWSQADHRLAGCRHHEDQRCRYRVARTEPSPGDDGQEARGRRDEPVQQKQSGVQSMINYDCVGSLVMPIVLGSFPK